jgi:hypothetical protein
MSIFADKLRNANEVHFLVEVNFNGLIDRIADANISLGDYFFAGKILNNVQVSTSFDFDSFRYSISSVSIHRANDDRFQDNERYRVMDGAVGKIWVWAPGLTWDDIEVDGCIFQGTFEKDYHNKKKYVFNLNDLTKNKMGTLTGASINTTTWPNHRQIGGGGSVAGKAAPVVFGEWSRGVPLLCVDTSGYKYVATYGVSGSTDADYIALTVNVYSSAGNVIADTAYEFVQGVDAIGNPCCYFDFTAEQTSNEPLTCSISGLTDGSGEYTGTAGTVLTHPADIMNYTMQKLAGMNTSYTDQRSIRALKQALPNLRCASMIVSETQTAAYLQRVLSQYLAAMVPQQGGGIGGMTLDMDATPKGRLYQDHHLLGDTFDFYMTQERLLCNRLELQYDYNPGTGAYDGVLNIDRFNDETCKRSYYQYGTEFSKTIQCPDIYREQDALWVADKFISIFAYRRYLINTETPYCYGWDFREGDCALIQLDDLPEPENGGIMARCVLIEKGFGPKSIQQRWLKIS